jgi:hypothetical protein
MPAKQTPEERMQKEQERLKRLEAQRARVRRKLSKLKRVQTEQERRDDTRRKILLGALVMDYADLMEENGHPEFQRWLRELYTARLVRPDDRELFGLEPLPNTAFPAGLPLGPEPDLPVPPLGAPGDVPST